MSSPTPTPSSSGPALPPKPKRRAPVAAIAVAVVLVLALVAGGVWLLLGRSGDGGEATAASGQATSQGFKPNVKIGVADNALPYWKTYTELAKSKLGVTVELVNFSDYSLPNPALKQGEIDLNQFQHIQYLANYNVTAGDDLQPIGATAIYPLPLYSTSVKDVASLPADAVVVIPNDAINQARALLLLQQAGLVQLKDGGTAFSDLEDVTSAKVKITPVAADQTARALQSGSAVAAVVNVNYAVKAGLTDSQVIAKDDPASPSAAPYVNVFAARAADKDDKTYLALAQLWHDPAVQKAFAPDYPSAVIVDKAAAELQADLAKVEQDAKAAKAAG
ncbi:D-methionine transport system substrate-binding protein [Quadrisphaera granulorum]|uniref:D-methionine transport system substrate-binding protein n=1 Tax=Quadrisphaera granulorum TaxID=317664 RepID=A0A315ZQP9_9ACTN|nr:MetQ/NlpA family ABC transporter substrate-binding protein [Quadrisphaera granulorum]PWJ47856.1 D-methionine transport system substrate-binding protein [Quadrisphaera granulorum]SZE98623.1 D-methionine transport system substrate-binding protein [Quadrisphaera granulorum]